MNRLNRLNPAELLVKNFVALGDPRSPGRKGLGSLAVKGAKFVNFWEVAVCAITLRRSLTLRVVLHQPCGDIVDVNVPFSISLPYACGKADLNRAIRWLERMV